MSRHLRLCALVAALGAAGLAAADEGAPFANHQGVLAGTADGPHKLGFSLYEYPNASAPIWGPQIFDNVPVTGGRYAVILGSTDAQGRPLSASLLVGKERYLGVSVDGAEQAARLTVAAPASAFAPASDSPARKEGGEGVPTGTVVALWGESVPAGWLPCDGSPIPEGAQYDRLRRSLGGKLPDLRGLFLRGAGQNGDPAYRYEGDAARAFGQLQQDEFKSHAHGFDDYTFSENDGVPGKAWGSSGKSDIDNSPGSPFKHDTAGSGGGETRPKNAAVNWIIKY